MKKSGVFIFWSAAKGYGLIQAEDGTKYFAHIMRLMQGSPLPRVGSICTFEVSARMKKKERDFAEADFIWVEVQS